MAHPVPFLSFLERTLLQKFGAATRKSRTTEKDTFSKTCLEQRCIRDKLLHNPTMLSGSMCQCIGEHAFHNWSPTVSWKVQKRWTGTNFAGPFRVIQSAGLVHVQFPEFWKGRSADFHFKEHSPWNHTSFCQHHCWSLSASTTCSSKLTWGQHEPLVIRTSQEGVSKRRGPTKTMASWKSNMLAN